MPVRAYYEESLALRRACGDRWGESLSLYNLANLLAERGDYAEAVALEEESLRIRRMIGDLTGIAASLAHLGTLAGTRGELAQAARYLEECVRLCKALGAKAKGAFAQRNLAITLMEQGDYARAQVEATEAAASLRAIGDARRSLSATLALGHIAYAQGQYDAAVAKYQSVVESARQMGERAMTMQALAYQGNALRRLRDDPSGGLSAQEQARERYHESLALARALGNRALVAMCWEGLASILCRDARAASQVDTIQSEIAVRLLAAASRLRAELQTPISTVMQPEVEQTMQEARQLFEDESAFASAWEAGRRLTWEEGIEMALSFASRAIKSA